MTLTIVLPLPHKALSPNARVNRFVLARAKKAYRKAGAIMALDAMTRGRFKAPPKLTAATVELRFFFKTNRRHDADNLIASMKSAMDGITDAGVWIDDSVVKPLPPIVSVDTTNPRVEVVITQEMKG